MQRRSFISNLAVILPAGMVAPKLLLDKKATYKNLVNTRVLILGAGNAALYIAGRLKEDRISFVIAEPSGGAGEAAIYNHSVKPAVISQENRDQKAITREISSGQVDSLRDEVVHGFIATTIEKTDKGFIVSDGERAFAAEQIIVSLPAELKDSPGSLNIKLTDTQNLQVARKLNGSKKRLVFRTISAARIDEDTVKSFSQQKTPGILAII